MKLAWSRTGKNGGAIGKMNGNQSRSSTECKGLGEEGESYQKARMSKK